MLFHHVAALVFWISGALLFYTFLGYGLLLSALARWRPGIPRPAPDNSPPSVCVVVVASNEEKNIADRLRNLLASPYPAGKLRVLLISDGSTDATVAQAQALSDARIEIVERPQRAGKAAGLNLAVSRGTGDILVFTDARQQFAEDAIACLTRNFADPAIGAVSGELEIAPAASATGSGVDTYWRYEKLLRAAESRWDSCIGCTGAIYALRRSLFTPIPEDTLLDDVVIPMQAAAHGARVIHDPTALAFDPQPLEPEVEIRRKQRTLAGGFQMLFRHPAWLLPWKNRLWWQLISHKYLRLLTPVFLATAFVANVAARRATALRHSSRGPGGAVSWRGVVCPARCAPMEILQSARGLRFLNLQVVRGLRYYLSGTWKKGWK